MSASTMTGQVIDALGEADEAAARRAVATRKDVVELIGTFFLVFTIGASVLSGSPMAPLAIGFSLAVMIYAGGHISGGAFNPAVTLGADTIGLLGWGTLWVYLIAQVIAGAAAGLTFRALNPDDK